MTEQINPHFVWAIDLRGLTAKNRVWRIETNEGAIREGRITDIVTQEVTIAGRKCVIPQSVELNGDSADLVAFQFIRSMNVV